MLYTTDPRIQDVEEVTGILSTQQRVNPCTRCMFCGAAVMHRTPDPVKRASAMLLALLKGSAWYRLHHHV